MNVFLCFVPLHVLQMCVLEKVAGLQASVLTERNDRLITVGVSLNRGAPVLLLFSLTGDNISFSETRELNTREGIFHVGHQIPGIDWKIHQKLGPHMKQSCNTLISETLRPTAIRETAIIYMCV